MGILMDVKGWEQVWNDAGSGKATDFSLWRGISPSPDHVVVGGFFLRRKTEPTAAETQGIKAVHKDVLVKVGHGVEIWTDAGMGSRQNGAVWGTSTTGIVTALDTGAFVPVDDYNNPPGLVYALDVSKVKLAMPQGLEVKHVTFSNRINNDASSRAFKDLSTWKA